MPNTPIYAFPFERPPFSGNPDEPGITLHGGSAGGNPILAEEVETEISRIDTDVADLQTRMAAMEAGTSMVGWVPVQDGSNTGASFDIDLTDGGRFAVGEFALVRLHMRHDLDADGYVNVRINNDTAAVYRNARLVHDSLGNLDDSGHSAALNRWQLGPGGTNSTNNFVATFFHMNGNFLHGFQSHGMQPSNTDSVHRIAEHWGSLTAALSAAPSSLRIFATDGATSFSNSWWWAEGYRVPA
jgi:hypothetical protein